MFTLLRHADVFAPAPLGRCDLLVAAGKILAIAPDLAAPAGHPCETVDLGGRRLCPGMIDAHVHLTGGGGESGPASRVPPIGLTALTRAGITSCVGVLGTDGTTRTIASLVARTLGLREEGLSAWCYTGSYELPLRTLTGSVRSDIVFVDPILGVGELAISDHRSSQPTFDEILRIASDCHVAGILSGKAGILHLHLGDGARGLDLVRRALDTSEIPARVFQPTHVNRRRALFEEALALAPRGCTVDVTAFPAEGESLTAEEAISRYLRAGLPVERITCSSDGAGCLPVFDTEGRLIAMDIGRPDSLQEALRGLLALGHSLAEALPPFTSNVAALLRLPQKGRIAVGGDADLFVLNEASRVCDVMARGRWMLRGGEPTVPDRFGRADAK
ncbi:MAG: beta-aspartyl-peptidase [Myxococcales bacterium]|nr:beta-aspartyl-peptidase [Myxococcales bacterium]